MISDNGRKAFRNGKTKETRNLRISSTHALPYSAINQVSSNIHSVHFQELYQSLNPSEFHIYRTRIGIQNKTSTARRSSSL